MGTICGLVGTAFHICVEYATGFRENNQMIIYFLPLAGIVIVFIYRICGIRHSKGTNLVIGSIRSVEDEIPSRMAPLIFISTVITHLFGGSSGREGAALQIGGSIGVSIGKLFKLDDSDKHILTLCGMSAVFSALFGTPITAALFSMEVISIGILYYCAFVPCLFSSVIAYAITKKLHVVHDHYNIAGMPTSMDVPLVIKVIGLAILCAVLSSLFCIFMNVVHKLFRKYFKNQYVRVFAGGVMLVLLNIILNTTDYNGTGMNIIAQALNGEAKPTAFLLKALFTAITIGCGFRGGEIVPSFFVGATFGCVMGGLMGLDRCPRNGVLLLWRGKLSSYISVPEHRVVRSARNTSVHHRMCRQLHAVRLLQPVQRAEDHLLKAPPSLCQSLHQPGDKDQGTGIPGRPYKDQGGRLRRH